MVSVDSAHMKDYHQQFPCGAVYMEPGLVVNLGKETEPLILTEGAMEPMAERMT